MSESAPAPAQRKRGREEEEEVYDIEIKDDEHAVAAKKLKEIQQKIQWTRSADQHAWAVDTVAANPKCPIRTYEWAMSVINRLNANKARMRSYDCIAEKCKFPRIDTDEYVFIKTQIVRLERICNKALDAQAWNVPFSASDDTM